MHPRTAATLNSLEGVEWFSNVGKPAPANVVVLPSWAAAIESCSSLDWENLCLEALNQYRERLAKKDPKRFTSWNEVVRAVKVKTIPLVRSKVALVVEKHALPKVFIDTVDWDILGLAMEQEFAEVYPPGFFASQAFWYKEGRFPCGWDGAFPSGKLIIY